MRAFLNWVSSFFQEPPVNAQGFIDNARLNEALKLGGYKPTKDRFYQDLPKWARPRRSTW